MSFGAGFLRFPDLFPGRLAGEPWGSRSVVLDVAGGPYPFSGLSATQEEAVRGKFAGLCRETETGAEVATRVFRAPRTDFLDFDVKGWEYTLDMDHSPAAVRLAGLRLMARLDWAPALSGGLWTPEEHGEEWVSSVFENYLRVLTAYRLLEKEGAVLHSAGVTDGESAWMLLGPSGAGKTTSSRLCLEQGGMVLSDDLNAVLLPREGPHLPGPPLPEGEEGEKQENQSSSPLSPRERGVRGVRASEGSAVRTPRLLRLPFTGDLGERSGGPASYPLAAVLLLVKGTGDGLRPISPAAALAGLVAAAPFVNKDPWRREALLAILERLARSVPAYELTFSLNGRLWDILRTIPT
jgi:hypothetical protein